MIVGATVGVFEYYLFSTNLLPVALLASLGALLGDLAGAFLKRRLKIKPGGALPGVDQLDFVLGALLLVSLFYEIHFGTILIMLFLTPPIHLLTNMVAHFLGLKSTYW